MIKTAQSVLRPDATEQEFAEKSVIICSAEPGNRVIAATDAFEIHTGYAVGDIMGKNLRFLQGKETAQNAVNLFRYLLSNCKPGFVDILNYHSDGRPFFHRVEMHPVFDSARKLQYFVALQTPIEL